MAEETSQDEKTEEPTVRRREDALRDGQVPRSKELLSAMVLMAAALALGWFGPGMAQRVVEFQAQSIQWTLNHEVDVAEAAQMIRAVGRVGADVLLPYLLFLCAVVLLVGFVQGRGALSLKPLKPKLEHLSPMKGIKRVFGWRAIMNLVKQTVRLLVVGAVAYSLLARSWTEILLLSGRSSMDVLATVFRLSLVMLGFTGFVYLLLALLDYGFEFWESEKKLRMSREEVKQEMKNTEGDPIVRQRVRSLMRALSRGQMLRETATADVVVTNPTHRAVAIRFSPEDGDPVPVVVAMGERRMAEQIRTIAVKNGVPIIENRVLARALMRTARVGRPIPEELWSAVIAVLRYVYQSYYGVLDPSEYLRNRSRYRNTRR
jgi:flagellar biosynthesis protein FlhB